MILFYGLALSIFLEYVEPGNFIPILGAIKIGTIVPLLTLVFAVAQLRPVSNTDLLKDPNTKWIIFYVFLLAVSVLTADVTLYSWTILKFVLSSVFWYIMLVKLVTDLDRLRIVIVVLVFSHMLLLVLNPTVVLEPETRSYLRAAPFLGDGNDFSLSVCVVLPLCIWLILTAQSRSRKIVGIASLALLILAIIGTQSRGASLALAGILMFLWWRGKRKVAGIVLITLLTVIVASFAPPQYFERMGTIANYQQEGSAMGRIIAWKTGVRMAVKYPITGVGSGHFPVALGTEFRPPEFGDQNLPWLTAHSMYFLVLGELGIPGIICFLGILYSNYRRLNRLARRARGSPEDPVQKQFYLLFLMLSASLVGFCIGGAFLSVAYYPHVFVLSGLITAASIVYERQSGYVGKENSSGDRSSERFVEDRRVTR